MKLRRLQLHNIRRFAGKTATLGPFGDGLTTVTAQNESGKSTFFDALHALIFFDHGSGKKELKELQPYSGGPMRICAEIELNGTDYVIEKRFNLKKSGSSATITSKANGTILKQADEAEQWIAQNILSTHNGPFGLLWVRQGAVGVDTGPGDIDARRDVMSSVRGQIDAVTGGRRMDSIVQRCSQELDAMSTKQDKPKAGSPWKEAEDRAEVLRDVQAELTASVTALGHDLAQKKQATLRLNDLHAPELRQSRTDAITKATEHLDATREHDRKIKDAEKDLKLLENAAREMTRDIDAITDAQTRREALAGEIAQNDDALTAAQTAKTKAKDALDKAQAQIKAKDGLRRTQSEKLSQMRLSERKAARRKRLVELSNITAQLQAPKAQLAQADTVLDGIEISTPVLDRLSDLERRRDIAIETRKIHFSSFTVMGDTASAQIAGKDIPNNAPHLIDQPVDLSLPGFGSIALRPAEGAGQGIEDPQALKTELTTELQTLGLDSLRAATDLYEARKAATQDQQTARLQIRALAPDGLDAHEAEWRDLCDELGHPHDKPAPVSAKGSDQAEPPSTAIEQAIEELDDTLTELRDKLPALQNALSTSAAAHTEAKVLLARLRTDAKELTVPKDEAATLQALTKSKSEKTQAISKAADALNALREAAPDLLAAQANHQRAVQADEQDRKEINQKEQELARLTGAIEAHSEAAVEEKLAEVTGQLERATERAAQFSDHAQALKLLLSHLEAARADAQETYFEPVRNELLPLLRQLHAGAEFQIDADKLLVDTITRNGVTDKLDALSGGAFEQIAILTRLAFAKLFAQQGNHVPIILDDALIHTDDERISTMFNMLAQIAHDQQIIVFSCRTRAFSDLGGERAFITEAVEPAPVSPD